MLTLLTATGCRPQAWAMCERLMATQDFAGPVRWVIVDDGEQPHPVAFKRDGWTLEVVRPRPYWQAGQNTQARNLASGLARIQPDASVVFVEDDDYYGPGFLTAIAVWLESAELVGESQARYYHIGRRMWRNCGNATHASLCSTAARGQALQLLRKLVTSSGKFIDIELWKQFTGHKRLRSTRHVVGMKGLPGRDGIGAGHRMQGSPDPSGQVLAEWLGAGPAAAYEAFRRVHG